MLDLPKEVELYKRTPTFTEQTVPEGLLNDHSTKAGTWGVLHIEQGKLKYVVTESGFEQKYIINKGATAIIAPEHKHHIKPLGEVSFYIAFYR